MIGIDFLKREALATESHLWSFVGKGMCCWLLWKHAQAIIEHWEFALVLLSVLILPKTFEAILRKRFDVQPDSH